MKKIGILQFPGSNCDQDIKKVFPKNSEFIFYSDHFSIKDYKAFIVPGGFSYGDYLRAGAVAAQSTALEDLREADKKGVPILGICNGFQILCEAQFLPGVLISNKNRRFIDEWTSLKLENKNLFWGGDKNSFSFPIAHAEGCYYHSEDCLKKIFDNQQVWLTYNKNPNGSLKDIAGVMNNKKNVAGLMPHPERAMKDWMGCEDGLSFFNSMMDL